MLQKITDDSSIKNIIFDLGGVLLNLSTDATIASFSRLSGKPQAEIKKIFESAAEFEQYERGEINDFEFRNFIRRIYHVDATDDQIDQCWVAMLKELPAEKLTLLDNLKTKYRTFLLSNTNAIHLDYFNTISLKPFGVASFSHYFHKDYYSHIMGKRKPEIEIFKQVLEENKLEAGETVFLDDNLSNLEGARRVGIKTVHIPHPDFVYTVFS